MSEFSCVREAWGLLLETFGESNMQTWGTFCVHEVFYWSSFVPFLIASRLPYLQRWKIQSDKPEEVSDVVHCAWRVALNHLCLVLPLILFTHPLFKLMGSEHSVQSLPTLTTIMSHLAFYMLMEDFVFYWIHRLLHTPWLYKNVHVVHHKHSAPFGIAAEYAHPFEVVFLGFATFSGPFLVPPHLLTLYAWLVVRMLQTVECHSGYDFPWSLNRWFPLYGGAEFHDHHHRIHSGNYSSTFIWVDYMFGTDTAYRIWRKQRRIKQQLSKQA